MSASNDLVALSSAPLPKGGIPIAHMRSVYRLGDVERRLDKLPPKEHESLRSTYERMLEKGPERFQVKPAGLPHMDHLYDELPNFTEVLDDVKRQLALCEDSRDALEITPLLLLGPPGIGKTHFAREISQLLGTGLGFISMSSLTAGWVLSGSSSQWKGARPGKVFETLVDGQYANPVMVVDEIDKAGGEHPSTGLTRRSAASRRSSSSSTGSPCPCRAAPTTHGRNASCRHPAGRAAAAA